MRPYAKALAAILAIILLVAFWLHIVSNLKQYEIILAIAGLILSTLIVIYVIVMLGIVAVENLEENEWVELGAYCAAS